MAGKSGDLTPKYGATVKQPSDAGQPDETTAGETAPCPVVGLGASAGGLDAFKDFLDHTPAESGLAFVIVQHLSPEHRSQLADLLSRCTAMPVRLIDGDMPVEPDTVFVIPENAGLSIRGGVLRPVRPLPVGGSHAIDMFFKSLAEDQGPNAACVVLSGAGSDGTVGLRAIKEHGGLTIAQTVGTAKYGSMLQSAIQTGLVDLELPVAEMPAKLIDHFRHIREIGIPAAGTDQVPDAAQSLRRICRLLLDRTGNDFSEYKDKTLFHRIARRMHVLRIGALIEYEAVLKREPEQIDLLLEDMLIGVTHFFRDPEAFGALEQAVIPGLFEDKTPADQVRVWVAGCSTGEEAYSIAIPLAEHAARLANPPRLQIFATDIDQRALEAARIGQYPAAIEQDVSPERLERFFYHDDGTYRVRREIRETCIFALHNLLRDVPFSRLDLLSCRNLLIYLNADLQNRLIPVLHFALAPNGFLFLGPSENVSQHARLFHPVDKRLRLFRRRQDGAPVLPSFPVTAMAGGRAKPPLPAADRRLTDPLVQSVEKIVLQRYAAAHVVVNEEYSILLTSGGTGRYLELPSGVPEVNVITMARPDLRPDLRAMLHKAVQTGRRSVQKNLIVSVNGGRQALSLIVDPLPPRDGDRLYMIVFQETAPFRSEFGDGEDEASGDPGDASLQQLQSDLHRAREQLQTTTEELEAANKELKSSNKELFSTNEELQSTNEELETSKEELQSVNEELQTVNSELNNGFEELARTNNDLKNLLQITQIGTLFLDRQLCVKNFTPAITSLFHLRDADIGRPIAHIARRFDAPELEGEAGQVIETLAPIEREVVAIETGSTYYMRMLPYRTVENLIDGVVITFVDVTGITQAEREIAQLNSHLAERLADLEALLDLAPIGIVIADDPRGRHTRINRRGAEILGISPGIPAASGALMQRNPPAVRAWVGDSRELAATARPLQQALESGAPVTGQELGLDRADGTCIDLLASAVPLFDEQGRVRGAIEAFDDITAVKRAQRNEVLRTQQQAVVAVLAARAVADSDPAQCLDDAVRAVTTTLEADLGEILELVPADGSFRLRAGMGWPGDLAGGVMFGRGLNSLPDFVLKSGHPVVITDLRSERRFLPSAPLLAQGMVSGVSAPIGGRDRPFGVLGVYSARPRDFSASDASFLASIANLLASTLDRLTQERALVESERRYRTLLDSANDAVFVFDLEDDGRPGRFREVNKAASRLLGRARDDLQGASAAGLIEPEPGGDTFEALLATLRSRTHLMFEGFLAAARGEPVFVEASARLIELGGRPTVLLIARDHRERRAAARRQALLMAELQHRVKNSLATIRAMAAQTLRTSPSMDHFAEAFEGRLAALATTHDLLVRVNFEEIELRRIVIEELAPYRAVEGRNLTIDGPAVLLKPAATQTLGMVFHELATNASKYGALSVPEGRIAVTWTVRPGPVLALEWRETGVHIAEPPARQGFGTTLIARALPFEVDGTAELEFPPEGAICRMQIPLTGKSGRVPEGPPEENQR